MSQLFNETLRLDRVSRIYPRDIADTPSNILREMFLPKASLAKAGADSFFAIKDVSLTLSKGQCMGVLGAHQSGKTTLAGLASGVLLPTAGHVTAIGERLLIGRPTAGFKPALTVIENLSFRTALAGVLNNEVGTIVESVLSRCGVSFDDARKPIGNLSPYVVKQLGMTLLLELPSDILIVDDVSSAGAGDARWKIRGRLLDKIELNTSLVLSEDPNFIQEVADQSLLLHAGRLYGPFDLDVAVDFYSRLPSIDEAPSRADVYYDPKMPPVVIDHVQSQRSSANQSTYDRESDTSDSEEERVVDQRNGPPWRVLNILVDGEDFKHAQYSLIRRSNEIVKVSLELVSLRKQSFTGGVFVLHGGNSGVEIASYEDVVPNEVIEIGQKCYLVFDFTIPDLKEDFYGLTYCPRFKEKLYLKEHRLKVLIFGHGKRQYKNKWHRLKITNRTMNVKVEKNGSFDTD